MYITVDGSIGAGKTTTLREIGRRLAQEKETQLPTLLDLEPVEKWEDLLKNAYDHQEGWFQLQMRVIRDRMWPPHPACWVERSLFMQDHTFVRPKVARGEISPIQYEIIKYFYSLAAERWSPGVYVYLRSTPEKCFERVQTRARDSELHLRQSYLVELHEAHERAFQMLAQVSDAPILVVDIDLPEGRTRTPSEVADEVLSQVRAALAREDAE